MRPSSRPLALTLLALTLACRAAERENASSDSAVLTDAATASGAVGAAVGRGAAAAPRGRPLHTIASSLAEAPAAKEMAPRAPGPAFPPHAVAAGDPAALVIRTGGATLEVDSLEVGVARVRAAVGAIAGAYVANLSLETGRQQTRRATLELKVPAADFDRLVAGLAPVGKVETVSVAAEDVSEEYVDVTARADNARRLEARLVDLLARRTGKLEDVLAVERELARVREEIERYEGRLRFLRTRAAFSTLAVTLHEPVPVLGDRPGANPIAAALREAWRNAVGFVAAAIALSGVLVPLAALGYLAWRVGRRFFRAPAAGPA
jgi:hypothetical protein